MPPTTSAPDSLTLNELIQDGDALIVSLTLPEGLAVEAIKLCFELVHHPAEGPQPSTTTLTFDGSQGRRHHSGRLEIEQPWPAKQQGCVRRITYVPAASGPVLLVPNNLQERLSNLWPDTDAAFWSGFAVRDRRITDAWSQRTLAQALWQQGHLGADCQTLLSMILLYKHMELCPKHLSAFDTAATEALLASLHQRLSPPDAPVSTLELQRRTLMWNWALWKNKRDEAKTWLHQCLLTVEGVADPMYATEYLLRARLVLGVLLLLEGQRSEAMTQLNALHALFQQGIAHANPARLHPYIRMRKSFQCTSMAGWVLRQLNSPEAKLPLVASSAMKVGINTAKLGRTTVFSHLGLPLEGDRR